VSPGPGEAGRPAGVLVMAHGTPATPEGIESFYTAIRRGRPPTPELLAELTGRYRAIGGTSPLTERTRAQVDGLAAALETADPGRFVVRFGAKFADPTIEEGISDLTSLGVTRIIGIVLTPHQSVPGSEEYFRRAREAASRSAVPVDITPVRSWHRAEGLPELLAERTGTTLASLPPEAHGRTVVFFTAHSVPERAIAHGDPYATQVAESAADVADRLGLDQREGIDWGVAWQSAGRTDDRWLGPDLNAEIRRVAEEGATSVVVCPVGFVADHLEVLYDLDVEAAGLAGRAGLVFARTPSLNDDPRFLHVLARTVRQAADGGGPNELAGPAGHSDPSDPGAPSGPVAPA
jgi:ferrochelatase